jgi:hypothetical protein
MPNVHKSVSYNVYTPFWRKISSDNAKNIYIRLRIKLNCGKTIRRRIPLINYFEAIYQNAIDDFSVMQTERLDDVATFNLSLADKARWLADYIVEAGIKKTVQHCVNYEISNHAKLMSYCNAIKN